VWSTTFARPRSPNQPSGTVLLADYLVSLQYTVQRKTRPRPFLGTSATVNFPCNAPLMLPHSPHASAGGCRLHMTRNVFVVPWFYLSHRVPLSGAKTIRVKHLLGMWGITTTAPRDPKSGEASRPRKVYRDSSSFTLPQIFNINDFASPSTNRFR
jgi:hypothetical protein